jgi:hypothetical protein
MRQGDLVVGQEYAFRTDNGYSGPATAARVRLTEPPSHGRATVDVLDPGPTPTLYSAEPWKQGQTTDLSTQKLLCTWEDWPAHQQRANDELAATRAEHQHRAAERGQERADLTRVDPTRPLPDRYEDTPALILSRHSEYLAALSGAYDERLVYAHATPEDVARVLGDLPIPVARDLVSAVRFGPDEGLPGTVGHVFNEAAHLVDVARTLNDERSPQLGTRYRLVTETHADFVAAVRDDIAAQGGRLTLPYVPALPHWLSDQRRIVAESLGWLRVAVGDTSGNRLHDAACHTISGRPLLLTTNVPLWQVLLERMDRECGVCGGPNVRDVLAFAHFTAAVEVWDARGRTGIEPWQRAALTRLIAASALSRAAAGEPDVTLLARIVEALAPDQPGEEGWDAYALVAGEWWNELGKLVAALSPADREAARCLARDRISVLEETLPQAQRPVVLPASATEDLLRERFQSYARWDEAEFVPRLLFGLPRAR